jgi:hypothetical protein
VAQGGAFIYPGEDSEGTWDNLEALLVLGDKYDMPGLASLAIKFLDVNQRELNGNAQDTKYIWKWIYLLDRKATDSNKPVREISMQRAALCFKSKCTMEIMKGLSREAMEMLAATLPGTVPFQGDLRGICKSCGYQGYDSGSLLSGLYQKSYFCNFCDREFS